MLELGIQTDQAECRIKVYKNQVITRFSKPKSESERKNLAFHGKNMKKNLAAADMFHWKQNGGHFCLQTDCCGQQDEHTRRHFERCKDLFSIVGNVFFSRKTHGEMWDNITKKFYKVEHRHENPELRLAVVMVGRKRGNRGRNTKTIVSIYHTN